MKAAKYMLLVPLLLLANSIIDEDKIVVLSDGTKVFLQDNSALTFPLSFTSGQDRFVKLTGEAIFDVADAPDVFAVHVKDKVVFTKCGVFVIRKSPDNSIFIHVKKGNVLVQPFSDHKEQNDRMAFI